MTLNDAGNPVGYFDYWFTYFNGNVNALAEGQPLPYDQANADGALGGNPAFGPWPHAGSEAGRRSERGWLEGHRRRVSRRGDAHRRPVGADDDAHLRRVCDAFGQR